MCLLKKCFKDNVKPAHWVGHSQIISLDKDDFSRRTPKFDVKQASLTVNTVKNSVLAGKESSVNEEANKVNDKKKYLVFTLEEENNNVE